MIVFSYTIIEPVTVMIKSLNACFTNIAMMRPIGFLIYTV